MKNRVLLMMVLCFGLIFNTVSAQDKPEGRNEIRLGYGVLTGPELANSLVSLWPAIGFSILTDTITDYRCSAYGVADLEYHRHLAKWVGVGVSLSINPISTMIKGRSGMEFSYNYYLLTVMPRVDFYYMRKGIFSMYSGIQAGISGIFWQDRQGSGATTDLGISPAFHVNCFGIRVGREIGAYMEWGFGFRGLVNFGVSGKF